jgi:competence protein ComEC
MGLFMVLIVSTLLDPPPLDLNTASFEELCRLQGIGTSIATAILEYRETISTFASVEELIFVPGIGPSTIESLMPFISATDLCIPVRTSHFLKEGVPEDTLLTVAFLDVGNGDAILIKAGESIWLIDGGPPGWGATKAPVIQRLKECGIDTLSVVAFTHPHADHIGGCRDVLEEYNCSTLIDPGIEFSSAVYETLLQYALDTGCRYSVLSGDDRWELSEAVSVEIVWLERGADSPNEASAVYLVGCGRFSLLITGDIENETIMRMTPFQTPITVMKVPHHGSRSSLFPPWIRRTAPQFAVFSCGRDNPFGHPHGDVLEQWRSTGSEILRTDRQGNIFLYTDGESISFSSSLSF